jgi:hypothetical protein
LQICNAFGGGLNISERQVEAEILSLYSSSDNPLTRVFDFLQREFLFAEDFTLVNLTYLHEKLSHACDGIDYLFIFDIFILTVPRRNNRETPS